MSTHLIGQCIKYFVAVDNIYGKLNIQKLLQMSERQLDFFIYVGTGY